MSLVDFDHARAASAAQTCRDAALDAVRLAIRLADVLDATEWAGGSRREADRVLGLLGAELRSLSSSLHRTADVIVGAAAAATATEQRRREALACQPARPTMSQGGAGAAPTTSHTPRTSSTSGVAPAVPVGVR